MDTEYYDLFVLISDIEGSRSDGNTAHVRGLQQLILLNVHTAQSDL